MARTRRASWIAVWLTLALAGSPIDSDQADPTPAVSTPPIQLPAALAPAARDRDWDAVREILAPRGSEPPGTVYRTLLGLHAHGAERIDEARRWLDRPPADAGGPLDDWALWVLADCLAALDETGGAQEALAALLAEQPASVLRDRARVKSAELAAAQGDLATGWRRIQEGRLEAVGGELEERLERVAWNLAFREGRIETVRASARRLGVHHPGLAAELGVDGWADPAGRSWEEILTGSELVIRARGLREAGEPNAAKLSIEAVGSRDRDLPWALETAEILLALSEGREALARLDGLHGTTRGEEAALAWARARAALDGARARPGDRLSSQERRAHRDRALHWLDTTARLAEDSDLALRALARLFEELAAEDRIDAALAVRERALELDPESDLGRSFLWNRGWREVASENVTGAIGYLTLLARDSRQDRVARGARYWLARSFERLGEGDKARELYLDLASSGVADFYHRHASARLGLQPARARGASGPGSWPTDETLERARFLSDAGLDALALFELEELASGADPRAADALRALILARQGEPRESMSPLYRAFPEVATPVQDRVPELARRLYYPALHPDVVERWADARGLPPALVYAVIRQESAFDERATSRAGARGLMQLMGPTAQELATKLGVPFTADRLYEPDYNLQLGTRYLRQVLDMFDGNVELALAGYNGGPYRIARWWRESGGRMELDRFIDGLPLSESRIYVHRILLLGDSYAQIHGLDPAAAIRTASGYTTEPDRALWVHSSAVRASGS